MKKNNVEGFIKYLEEQVNKSLYVWGAQGESAKSIIREWVKKKETSDKNVDRVMKHLDKRMPSNLNFYDCSGLGVSWLLEQGLIKSDMTAAGMYAICRPISKSEVGKGDWVFIKSSNGTITHVGYMADAKNVVESAGRDVGVIKRPLTQGSPNGQWTHFGRPDKIFDFSSEADTGQNNSKKFNRVLKLSEPKMRGEDVAVLQSAIGVSTDGIYGENTKAAVVDMQKRLFPTESSQWDGAAGQKTIEGLRFIWIGER